ncbi:ubiquinol-cytochrome c reductase iron-sulfur subunit [Bosea caraganae]|uniref:Ubiquinol-cytochrome c reductase iron-sulfur subunit n=1 Tax=Bosea caraganae TaxID=2763117 RepID=A0A370L6U9_9HYPH|nr:ubiquinol-cytochrome c reductase iron-sulfur subunit [Bosea caraganae]RDJ25331.1 ubiquinol-cytochrome c reductase iron-sulfur subunit [Bosea caraganae]RDJ25884.1 ubiquinol-cytochrome c reductase iron-sulfur subunit [Bosea caraganae]
MQRNSIVAHATDTTATGTTRRDFLMLATGAAGAVGIGAVVIPLISQLAPDAQVLAAGAPMDLDLAPIAEGQAIKLFWRGKLIFARHRTKKEIDEALAVDISTLRDPQTDLQRTKPGHEQYLIVYGNCTHLGCVPLGNAPGDPKGDFDGWFCPCHGSHYDSSGRIRKGPAPLNLPVPPYAFTADTKIKIG